MLRDNQDGSRARIRDGGGHRAATIRVAAPVRRASQLSEDPLFASARRPKGRAAVSLTRNRCRASVSNASARRSRPSGHPLNPADRLRWPTCVGGRAPCPPAALTGSSAVRQALHLRHVRRCALVRPVTDASSVFEVTTRYVDLQPVGMGAFGLVCSAKDQLTGTAVAIKKVRPPRRRADLNAPDYEAVLDAGPRQADVPRAQAAEAHPTCVCAAAVRV